MVAMAPVFEFMNGLEGFEWTAFWVGLFCIFMFAGFFIDYLMQKQGFGPYFNSLFAAAGTFLGLYLRFNYIQPSRIHFYDPYLSIACVFGATALLIVMLAFLRNRTS